jgi:hypothetical protein
MNPAELHRQPAVAVKPALAETKVGLADAATVLVVAAMPGGAGAVEAEAAGIAAAEKEADEEFQ